MLNFTYFADKHGDSQARFQKLAATPDMSAADGTSFHADPALIMNGDTSQTDFVLENLPNAKLIVSFAVDQMPDNPPFQTLDVGGRLVPVITDPSFISWLISAAYDFVEYLDEVGRLDSLYAIHFSPFGNTPDDGQFHIPGDAAAWAAIGVNHETVAAALLDYSTQLAAIFPGVLLHMSTLNPYNDYIGALGNGDGGKAYLALQATLQSNLAYVTFDQTLKAPDERSVIRDAVGTGPYGAMIATLDPSDTAGILATAKLAQGYGAKFLIWQDNMVSVLKQFVSGSAP
jgi:hypothetical protein